MKQTNFQRKKKFKRMQIIINKQVNNLCGNTEFMDNLFYTYRDLLINGPGIIENSNEGYMPRPYIHELTNI